jgi:hypothetical protein
MSNYPSLFIYLTSSPQGDKIDCICVSDCWGDGIKPNFYEIRGFQEVPVANPIGVVSSHGKGDIIYGGGSMSTKSCIYKFLRLWNDASAVKKGKVGKRIGRRAAGKTTGRLLRKLFK